MIILIASNPYIHILDSVCERNDWEVNGVLMDQGSLNDYIVQNMHVLVDVQYIVIEHNCVAEKDEAFQDVLDNIMAIWDVPVILLEDSIEDKDGEKQLVRYQERITLIDKFQDNLDNNLEYLLRGDKIPAEKIYDGIWIGVMTSNSGAGATHVAISLANYIHNQGESVCYVEANESGDLAAMSGYYEMNKLGDNHYEKGGIDYWHQSIDPEKKYAVIDMGKYNSSKIKLFSRCKVQIMLSDGKPYRMADAINVMRNIGNDATNLVLNFVNQEEVERLVSAYNIPWKVYGLSWHSNMFEGMDNAYAEMLSNYIQPVSGSKTSIFFMPDKIKKIMQKKRGIKKLDVAVDNMYEEPGEDVTEDTYEEPEENVTEDIYEEPEKEVVEDTYGEPEEDAAEDTYEEPEEDAAEDTYEEPEEDVTEDTHEEPEKDAASDNILQKLLDEENKTDTLHEEDPFEEPYVVTDKKPRGKKILNALLFFCLIAGISVGTYILSPDISDFLFKNREQPNPSTELVDEQLNINPDIKISVLEVDGADGYEVSYSTDQKFPEEKTVVVEVETADKAVESLAAGKTYYVRVRAFKYNEDGIKVYGEYTDIQEIET